MGRPGAPEVFDVPSSSHVPHNITHVLCPWICWLLGSFLPGMAWNPGFPPFLGRNSKDCHI